MSKNSTIQRLFELFRDPLQLQLFILNIFSAIPLQIIYSTISAWLKDANIAIEIITTFFAARLFYSLNFLWAPVLDHLKIYKISQKFGLRKSWLLMCAFGLMVIMILFSQLDPSVHLSYIFYLTLLLGVISATYDVVINAYRIEIVPEKMQSIAAANSVLGYRVGLLLVGYGSFKFADDFGWSFTYFSLATIFLFNIIFIFSLREPGVIREKVKDFSPDSIKVAVINPFIDFFSRQYSILILLAIIFYKLGDAMLGGVATPFYMDLGFSKTEIANIVKLFGFTATMLGYAAGGVLLFYLDKLKGLMLAGVLQAITNLIFVWLSYMGHDIYALAIAIFVENIAAGMGTIALVTYITHLCNIKYSATQYTLLSSAASFFSQTLVVYSGKLQTILGWEYFFVGTVIISIPGLLMLLYLDYKLSPAKI